MTKKKIAWIADSVSCISPEVAAVNNINVVPLSLIFGDEVYKDGEITNEEFYAKLETSAKSPTTSQPAIGDFVELYERLKEEYEIGIAVHVTSVVSGTYNTSVMAAEMAGFPVLHIDSKIGAKAQEYMILEGIRLEKEGKNAEEIAYHLRQLADNVQGKALVGSLEQLHKGGRVSGLGMLVGNLFQIKPILEFNDGALVPREKVRTTKKAEKRIIDIFKDSFDNHPVHGVSISHCDSPEKADEFKAQIKEINPNIEVQIGNLSPVLAAHLGKGTIALFWFEGNK